MALFSSPLSKVYMKALMTIMLGAQVIWLQTLENLLKKIFRVLPSSKGEEFI